MGANGNCRACEVVDASKVFGNGTICLLPVVKNDDKVYIDTGEFDDIKVSYTLNGVTHIQPLKNKI